MKLSASLKHKITSQLIIRINELYHDFEQIHYSERQKNMFEKEKERWLGLANKFIVGNHGISCLDYGSGSGFVPQTIMNFLNNDDKFICVDVSKQMLEICENNLKYSGAKCKFEFIKTDGVTISLPDKSIDFITINSVLHHIPNIEILRNEAARLLKPAGLLIIVHEPNGNDRLPNSYHIVLPFFRYLLNPSLIIEFLAEKNKYIESFLRRILNLISERYRFRNKFLDETSRILIREKLIDLKLRGSEIQQLVDIQTEKGFIKKDLHLLFQDKFEIIYWETFDYWGSGITNISRKINAFLHKKFPENGKLLSFVLQKK